MLPLGLPELARVLELGDGPERVWAAWALGIRDADRSMSMLTNAGMSAPDPGVRMTLAIVLAGHKQEAALAVMVTDDPDEDVRAASCRALSAISPGVSWVRELLEKRLEDERGIAARIVLLDLVIDGQLTVGDRVLERDLGHPDNRIRDRAMTHALDRWTSGSVPPGFERILSAADPTIRARGSALFLERLGAPQFLIQLAVTNLDHGQLAWHLHAMRAVGTRLAWPELAPMLDVRSDVDSELLGLLREDSLDARAWMLRVAGRGRGVAIQHAIERLRPLLRKTPKLTRDELDDARIVLRHLAAQCEEAEQDLESMGDAANADRDMGWLDTLREDRDLFARLVNAQE